MEYLLFIVAFFAFSIFLGYLGYKFLRKKDLKEKDRPHHPQDLPGETRAR